MLFRFRYLLLCFFVASAAMVFAQQSYVDEAAEMIESSLNSTEILIRVCTVLLILFTVFFIGFFITLMIARSTHRYDEQYEKNIKEKFELLLTGVIFNDDAEMQTDEWKASRKRVVKHFKKRYLHKRINKKYLREHIILLHKNFIGSAADVLRNLYIELKLDRQAIKELNSPDWGIQANAVKELAQLNITKATEKIKNRTQHENQILRLEAQVASIRLDKKDPFSFLDKNRNYLTEWHQVNLAHIIDQINRDLLPDFSRWFVSPNPTVVEFCIKMTLQYDQFASIPALSQLLYHKNQHVVGEAAKALGEFGVTEAQSDMLYVYRDAITPVKLQLLKAIGKCGNNEILPFLIQQLLQNDINIAMEAANSLKKLGEEGIAILEKQTLSNLYGVGDICKHVLDERI
ncbi:MAG: HEAT repeat domain-containing protein [Bacteroidota bacterium]